jgi:predicted RNA methylase
MKLSQEVISVLDAARCEGNMLYLAGSPKHLPETPRLDRNLYMDVNHALKALGGQWTGGKVQAHVFEEDIADAISDAVAAGDVENRKQVLGFFETPPELVERMIGWARVEPNHTVLEPSAGRGAIAYPLLCEYAGVNVAMIEIDEKNTRHMKDSGINGKGKRFKPESYRIVTQDFLKCKPAVLRDRVIMNPPFSRQQDISHCLHAYDFLLHSGWLISIMSAGVLFRQDKRSVAFRKFVEEQDGVIDRLPEGSFQSSGTMVSTCVLKLQKKGDC